MKKIRLDPRLIIGEITVNTPMCVVDFIATLCRITFNPSYWGMKTYIDDFTTALNSRNFVDIDLPLSKTSTEILSKCLRFLNPKIQDDTWSSASIIDGIENISLFFEKTIDYSKVEQLFGSKTNTIPTKNNEIMTYRICKDHNYPMNNSTDFEEMIFASKRFLKQETIPALRKHVLENIKHLPNEHIVRYAYDFSTVDLTSEYELEKEKYRIEEKHDLKQISRASNLLNDIQFLLQRVMPTDSIDAIILAVHRFGICISGSRNPLKQFHFLCDKKFTIKTIGSYVPIDDVSFCLNYTKNPKWYMTSNNWFEDLIPTYNSAQLLKYAKMEGYTEPKTRPDDKQLISFLKERRKNISIYFGIVPQCNKTVTYIHATPIVEIPENQLLCCGSLISGELEYYSIEEFSFLLSSFKMFLDPVSKEPFESSVVLKVKNYLNESTVKMAADRHIFREAIETIENIDKIKSLIDYKIKELTLSIKDMDEDLKLKFRSFFDTLIEMGFYMRGWKVNGRTSYPLINEDTVQPFRFKDEIDDNIIKSYDEVMEIYNGLPFDLKDSLKILHLIKFSYKGETEDIFGMTFKGAYVCRDRTLMECVHQSMFGDPRDETSCIRSNSNWIIFTSAWYSYIFGFPVEFRFDKLDDIT